MVLWERLVWVEGRVNARMLRWERFIVSEDEVGVD